jgi:hypothetical protein
MPSTMPSSVTANGEDTITRTVYHKPLHHFHSLRIRMYAHTCGRFCSCARPREADRERRGDGMIRIERGRAGRSYSFR